MALISVFIKKAGSLAPSFDLEDTQITSFGVLAINAVSSDTLLGATTNPFELSFTTNSSVYTLDGENAGVTTFGVDPTTNSSVYTLDGENAGVTVFGIGAQARFS